MAACYYNHFFNLERQINLTGLFESLVFLPTLWTILTIHLTKLKFMRKILFLFLGSLPFVFSSCNNGTTTETSSAAPSTSMADKNLASSQIVTKAFETGDPSMIDSAVASDFVDHTDRGDKNRDSLKAMIVQIHKEFPDMKTQVIKEVADDDYVFSLMRFTGTSNGTMGMPKGPYDMHAVQVVKFKDGKAVEHWEYMQPAEMMKMMPPPPDAKKK